MPASARIKEDAKELALALPSELPRVLTGIITFATKEKNRINAGIDSRENQHNSMSRQALYYETTKIIYSDLTLIAQSGQQLDPVLGIANSVGLIEMLNFSKKFHDFENDEKIYEPIANFVKKHEAELLKAAVDLAAKNAGDSKIPQQDAKNYVKQHILDFDERAQKAGLGNQL